MVEMKAPQTEFSENKVTQQDNFAVKLITQLEVKFDNHMHCNRCFLPMEKPVPLHDAICDKCKGELEKQQAIVQPGDVIG